MTIRAILLIRCHCLRRITNTTITIATTARPASIGQGRPDATSGAAIGVGDGTGGRATVGIWVRPGVGMGVAGGTTGAVAWTVPPGSPEFGEAEEASAIGWPCGSVAWGRSRRRLAVP